MVFNWKPGSRFKGDPQAIGERITALSDKSGAQVSPEMVLDDAKKKTSPMHNIFTWNDDTAAHQWRTHQARMLLNHITVQIEECEDSPPVRAFVCVKTVEDGSTYVPMVRAMNDAELRSQVLESAWNELVSFKKKYGEYKELSKVFSAMDNLGLNAG